MQAFIANSYLEYFLILSALLANPGHLCICKQNGSAAIKHDDDLGFINKYMISKSEWVHANAVAIKNATPKDCGYTAVLVS